MQVEKTKFSEEKPVYAYDQLCCGDVFTWGTKREIRIKINENLMFDPHESRTQQPEVIWGAYTKWPELEVCKAKLLVDGLD